MIRRSLVGWPDPHCTSLTNSLRSDQEQEVEEVEEEEEVEEGGEVEEVEEQEVEEVEEACRAPVTSPRSHWLREAGSILDAGGSNGPLVRSFLWSERAAEPGSLGAGSAPTDRWGAGSDRRFNGGGFTAC
ncbi:unnamed protein product [Boreogadus saida]